MPADRLCERITAETGLGIGVPLFVETLRARPERFAVMMPPFSVREQSGWRTAERTAYERALADAGLSAPVVTLAAALTQDTEALPAPGAPPGSLADVHAAVAELIEQNGADEEFVEALATAVAQLEAVRLVLEAAP
jgi:hypothetical protein